MEQKESKSSKHFCYSMAKSLIRVLGFACLFYNDYRAASVLLILAEALGILEEF